MPPLADLQKKVQDMGDVLTNIENDIARIKAQLPAEGGLSAEQVAELSLSLDTLAGRLTAVDAATPETDEASA